MTRGTTKDNVAVEVYTVPGHYVQAPQRVDTMLSDAIRSIEQMGAMVGPYPYPVYRVVDAGLSMPGGVEFPMLSMVGSRLRNVDVLVSHETAHQWFFGLLGTHPQTETWVDEGAASFFEEAIYSGVDASITLSRKLPCDVNISVWDLSVSFRDHYFCVYDGGRKVYGAIRDAMGTDRFVASLHDLYARDRYGIITARDLLTNFHSTARQTSAPSSVITFPTTGLIPSLLPAADSDFESRSAKDAKREQKKRLLILPLLSFAPFAPSLVQSFLSATIARYEVGCSNTVECRDGAGLCRRDGGACGSWEEHARARADRDRPGPAGGGEGARDDDRSRFRVADAPLRAGGEHRRCAGA